MVRPASSVSTTRQTNTSAKETKAKTAQGKSTQGSSGIKKIPVKRQRKNQSVDDSAALEAARAQDVKLGELTPQSKKAAVTTPETDSKPERRARRFRDHAPQSFLAKLEIIRQQRMFVVSQAVGSIEENLELLFDIIGSTGNLYKVTIKKEPECDCPDGRKGNFCKHIIYILVFALKAPSNLQYQLAFLSSEIREIYEGSPLKQSQNNPSIGSHDGNQKPIEGDCPVCFMEFEPEEALVWCQEGCGNNIHKACFQQWAATSTAQGTNVRCVYCRAPWKSTNIDTDTIRTQSQLGADGYFNAAAQFGLSAERDYSVYSPFSTVHRSFSSGRPRSNRHYSNHS